MYTKTPDIRIHSNDQEASYGFRPLTAAGLAFVAGHAAMVSGQWYDGVFWFQDYYMPFRALNDTHLHVVIGKGSTSAHDREWQRERAQTG